MDIAVISFTRAGNALALQMEEGLKKTGHVCACTPWEKSLSLKQWTETEFGRRDALVFIGAAGIAVRAVAPWLKDKMTDPAVLAIDEKGRFVIPLVSGHVGGANRLAKEISTITGGKAVITTATDVNGLFAPDVFAVEHGLAISDRQLAKQISAALLDGKTLGWVCEEGDYPAPEGFSQGFHEKMGVWITVSSKERPGYLRLIPRTVTIGTGCRKGTPKEELERAFLAVLKEAEISPLAVEGIATIDRKQEEPGLVDLARERDWKFTCYPASALEKVSGDFSDSSFVEKTVGVGNVCERAAVLKGGELIKKKRIFSGITVALAKRRKMI